jgi:hypothetical protein
MPDPIAKDYQEKDCDSDNPGSLPERVVATTAYVAVKGRAMWHQSLQRQLMGRHCRGKSKVECEEDGFRFRFSVASVASVASCQPRQPCLLYT